MGMETGYWGQKVRADSGEPLAASIHYETRQLRPGEDMQLAQGRTVAGRARSRTQVSGLSVPPDAQLMTLPTLVNPSVLFEWEDEALDSARRACVWESFTGLGQD